MTTRRHASHGEDPRSASSDGPTVAPRPGDLPSANAVADGYAPPRLLVYGTIRTLTATGGRVGKNDKAVKHSRTGF
jgi:hypothetical protein